LDNNNAYEESVNYLYGLQKFGIKFGLSKTENLLEAFGNPHEGQRYIHIAGTNGKGSTAALMASVLKEAGYKVGLYSSPHLVRFTERFNINGKEMSEQEAHGLIQEMKYLFSSEEPPTFFEATTAMALVYFARENTDIAIMEVGMGGRLDATNIINPMVCGITNISMEHREYLGNTLLEVAGEKAGVIKEGVDLITAATKPGVLRLFEETAREKGAPFRRVGKDIRYQSRAEGLSFHGRNWKMKKLQLGLTGKFQVRNGVLALGMLEVIGEKGFRIPENAIREGLRNVVWSGRMQVVDENPTIMLDGAHNPGAARALADSIGKNSGFKRVIMVVGIMEDKEILRVLRPTVSISDYIIYTRPAYWRAAAPEILMQKAAFLGKPGEIVPELIAAISKAKEIAGPKDLILITGSLFTVGEALAHFEGTRPDF
jgi:dihydrofolate synthase/folylpolyglutamate synthase